MSIFAERSGMTRREFFKGAGILFGSVLLTGVFARFGIDASAAGNKYIKMRSAGLYALDEAMTIRKSHENPEVLKIYKEFLSPGEVKPISEKAHHLLHTKYGKDIPAMIGSLKSAEHEAA